MSRKKDVMRDALLRAREVEEAASLNAKDIIVKAVAPRIQDLLREGLSEIDLELDDEEELDEEVGPDLPNEKDSPSAKGKKVETDTNSPVANQDGSTAAPAPKGELTQKSGSGLAAGKWDEKADEPGKMTEEEDLDMDDDEEELGETERDNGKMPGDVPRDGGVDDELDESEDSMDYEDDDDMNEEDELDIDIEDDELDIEDDLGEEDLPPVDDEDDVFGDDDFGDEESDDEELEIPDELFDDGGDEPMGGEDDEELDIDIEDDEDTDDSFEMESDDMDLDSELDFDDSDEENYEEGLYIRREGKFKKITPSEALEDRIKDLEEEKGKLSNAVKALSSQLRETNLFNMKLSYVNKLYESGLFSRQEKATIAEQFDKCRTVGQVKRTFQTIGRNALSRTPLDEISSVIVESRSRRVPTGEKVFESPELKRMQQLAGIKK